MKGTLSRRWWETDPAVFACNLCGCPVQRSAQGVVADGLRAYIKLVHPGYTVSETPVSR